MRASSRSVTADDRFGDSLRESDGAVGQLDSSSRPPRGQAQGPGRTVLSVIVALGPSPAASRPPSRSDSRASPGAARARPGASLHTTVAARSAAMGSPAGGSANGPTGRVVAGILGGLGAVVLLADDIELARVDVDGERLRGTAPTSSIVCSWPGTRKGPRRRGGSTANGVALGIPAGRQPLTQIQARGAIDLSPSEASGSRARGAAAAAATVDIAGRAGPDDMPSGPKRTVLPLMTRAYPRSGGQSLECRDLGLECLLVRLHRPLELVELIDERLHALLEHSPICSKSCLSMCQVSSRSAPGAGDVDATPKMSGAE